MRAKITFTFLLGVTTLASATDFSVYENKISKTSSGSTTAERTLTNKFQLSKVNPHLIEVDDDGANHSLRLKVDGTGDDVFVRGDIAKLQLVKTAIEKGLIKGIKVENADFKEHTFTKDYVDLTKLQLVLEHGWEIHMDDMYLVTGKYKSANAAEHLAMLINDKNQKEADTRIVLTSKFGHQMFKLID